MDQADRDRHLFNIRGEIIQMWDSLRTVVVVPPMLAKVDLPSNMLRNTVQNALVESIALHCRSLADFLESRGRRDDDMRASDFSDTWNPPASILTTDEAEFINKHLAHLTNVRTTGPGAEAKIFEIEPVIRVLEASEQFFAHIGEKFPAPRWREELPEVIKAGKASL